MVGKLEVVGLKEGLGVGERLGPPDGIVDGLDEGAVEIEGTLEG